MSERTEISFDAALMMALRADAQKELDELPTPAQLKERYPDTSRWDARLKAALHKRRPVLKRVLVAAMTLVILTLGALAVSADFRKAVYTMIQKFLPIEMQLTYQVDGEPLEQLPNGYSDHYVPDGFERDYRVFHWHKSCGHSFAWSAFLPTDLPPTNPVHLGRC